MALEKLKQLVKQGESQQLEFKTSLAQLKPGFETLCGFLNGDGGIIIFGVKDNGDIVGQHISDSTRQSIANEIHKIEPPVRISVEYISCPGEKVVVIMSVDSGKHIPYTYDGRAFRRDQSVTKRMQQQQYDLLVTQRSSVKFSWEKMISEDHTIDNLDKSLIASTVQEAVAVGRMPATALTEDTLTVLDRLKLLTSGKINNAAVVLFSAKGSFSYLQCQLKVARFKGTNRNEFLDNDLFRGNFFELLDRGLMFVRRHIPVAARIEPGKLERVETPLIPFPAIREALINALCHRDYSSESGSIGLAIYDDRMEIFNDARLTSETTVEKIKEGFSNPPNPIIAEVCYREGLIEKWGRGVPGIIEACKIANDPEPNFAIDKIEFKVVFAFPVSMRPPVVNEFYSEDILTDRQSEILQLIVNKQSVTSKVVMEFFPAIPERTVRRELARLREFGFVDMKGHAGAAEWFLIKK